MTILTITLIISYILSLSGLGSVITARVMRATNETKLLTARSGMLGVAGAVGLWGVASATMPLVTALGAAIALAVAGMYVTRALPTTVPVSH